MSIEKHVPVHVDPARCGGFCYFSDGNLFHLRSMQRKRDASHQQWNKDNKLAALRHCSHIGNDLMGITVPREMASGVTFEFCCTLSADCVHASSNTHVWRNVGPIFLVVSLFVFSLSIGNHSHERTFATFVCRREVCPSQLT